MVQPRNTASTMSKPEPNVKPGAANEPAQVGAGGNREDVDAATQEALRDELISEPHKVDCSKGMRLLKIGKYPTKHDDKESAVELHIIVKEQGNKSIRVGAIVVNGVAVKGKDKITHWKGLRHNANYMQALLTSLGESTPKSLHAFQATLRYPEDFVLAVIAPPNITRYPDEALPEGVIPDKSLEYNIVVQRNKHPRESPTNSKQNLVKRWFKRFTWKSVNEKVAEAERKSPHEKKSDGYVTMAENSHTQVPVQASAPRLDDTPYGVAYEISEMSTLRSASLKKRAGSEWPSEGIQAAMKTYGIPAVLAIGSAGAAIGGAVWMSKRRRMKSYIGL